MPRAPLLAGLVTRPASGLVQHLRPGCLLALAPVPLACLAALVAVLAAVLAARRPALAAGALFSAARLRAAACC